MLNVVSPSLSVKILGTQGQYLELLAELIIYDNSYNNGNNSNCNLGLTSCSGIDLVIVPTN